jgi:hypothetical protein
VIIWPRAHNGLGVTGVEVLAAFRAHDSRADTLTARLVQQVHWRGGQAGPLVAPVHQRDVDGKQRQAFGGEPELVQVASGVLSLGEYAGIEYEALPVNPNYPLPCAAT